MIFKSKNNKKENVRLLNEINNEKKKEMKNNIKSINIRKIIKNTIKFNI